jgi:hypothetical protein
MHSLHVTPLENVDVRKNKGNQETGTSEVLRLASNIPCPQWVTFGIKNFGMRTIQRQRII